MTDLESRLRRIAELKPDDGPVLLAAAEVIARLDAERLDLNARLASIEWPIS